MATSKSKILKALFSEAANRGIDQETLRDDIAYAVIGKRLSQAHAGEVARVLDYIHGRNQSAVFYNPNWKKYASSRAGLLDEIKDLAITRFGQDYVEPLNSLCARFGESDGYRKMRVSALKELKRRLNELNQTNPRMSPLW